MKKPSIREVARLAGVGTSTVSRALNNHPSISEEARTRVLSAVKELDYTPNITARRLRTGQTHAASILLPMTETAFYTRLLTSIQAVLDQENLDIALFPVVQGIRIKRYRDPAALPYHADGLIIASLDPDRIYLDNRPPFDGPVVLVDTHHPDYHSVYFDNREAGRMAASHALESGLPVALIDVKERKGAFESPVFRERRAGIFQGLQRYGIEPVDHLRIAISPENGRIAAQELAGLAKGEGVAVIAICDDLAVGALRQFEESELGVGSNTWVIGFDDQQFAAESGLTTVAQPIEQMGSAAAELLLKALANRADRIEQISFPPTLLVRRSTGGTDP